MKIVWNLYWRYRNERGKENRIYTEMDLGRSKEASAETALLLV